MLTLTFGRCWESLSLTHRHSYTVDTHLCYTQVSQDAKPHGPPSAAMESASDAEQKWLEAHLFVFPGGQRWRKSTNCTMPTLGGSHCKRRLARRASKASPGEPYNLTYSRLRYRTHPDCRITAKGFSAYTPTCYASGMMQVPDKGWAGAKTPTAKPMRILT